MATLPSEGTLDLLLADADDHRPVLDGGLPGDALSAAKKPKKQRGTGTFLRDKPDADPNDLPAQRWGVVAPEGRAGDRLLDAVAPLIRLREAEQGAPARVYRVPAEMNDADAIRFREDVYRAEDVPEHERPRYVLLLGDLDQVSLELQHVLANGSFVGRLAFTDATGDPDPGAYRAYAEKVVALTERPSGEEMPDACFFNARDGSAATALAAAQLVGPCLAEAERLRQSGHFPAARVVEMPAGGPDDLLRATAGARPSVMLSVSHGLGAPRGGWKSYEQQRALQGALALGGGDVLRGEEIVGRPFLPGGMWFCLACFGVATPAASVYYPWLLELAKEGVQQGRLDGVLKSLPKPGESPFLAALPQAALANPEGPLAVIGHADLAWSYAFSRGKGLSEGSAQKIFSAIKVLVNGSRVGVGLDALMRSYREATDALQSLYQREADARAWGKPDPTDRKERAQLWMLSHDLRGYMLVGDPAARLPLGRAPEGPRAEERAALEIQGAPGPVAKGSTEAAAAVAEAAKQEAVRALLQGDEAPRAIAARAGASLEDLWAWFDAHRQGRGQ